MFTSHSAALWQLFLFLIVRTAQCLNCLSVRLKIKLKYSLDSTIIIKSFLSVYLYFLRFSEQVYYLCIL
ncbi:hypothetical protein HMPREF1548_03352 [Clostridium sp. KLE 1755]|nr:hypothetical protein HMPREF1548_03352 [Clostridium sp. KLE 1755]